MTAMGDAFYDIVAHGFLVPQETIPKLRRWPLRDAHIIACNQGGEQGRVPEFLAPLQGNSESLVVGP
jgi:hypothetical protein